MNRRKFLASASMAVPTVLAGCLSRPADPGADDPDDSDPDAAPVLTGYTVSDQVVTLDGDQLPETEPWGLFLATADAADRHFETGADGNAEAVRSFVDETDFESGDRLLYVLAYAPQTCYELRLDGEPRIADDGRPFVPVETNRTAPDDEPCGDAITPVAVLLRLTFDPDGSPADVVAVHLSGHWDDTQELLIEAER